MDQDSQPTRVVIDPSLNLLSGKENDYKLFTDELPTILYHTVENYEAKRENENVSIVYVASTGGSESSDLSRHISPSQVVKDLKMRGITNIMVEGGPATARSFLSEGLVDRAILVRAPVKFIEPVPSFMSEDTLQQAGLSKLGMVDSVFDGDNIDYWTRPGMSWPTEKLEDWP